MNIPEVKKQAFFFIQILKKKKTHPHSFLSLVMIHEHLNLTPS